MKHTIECIGFRPLAKSTLVGFAKIRINELKLVINDVTLHRQGEARWAGLPARPQIDSDGTARRDNRAKVAYVSILEFASRDASEAFSRAVWDAVERVGALEAAAS
jgi:hypothetical protein